MVRGDATSRASVPERGGISSTHIATRLLEEFAAEEIDLGRAALLAVAHDFVENLVGDTFAYGDATAGQRDRERAAVEQLRESTDLPGIRRLVGLWEEYESQETPAARFVKGLDALLPIALNFANPEHSSWRLHNVAADKVRARLSSHGDAGRQLREYGEQMIHAAHQRGDLV